MVKRICALLLALLLPAGSCLADLKLREKTPAQQSLKTYITNVNSFLAENGEEEINKIFDQLDSVVELGITSTDDALIPEDVTVTVYLYYNSINSLLLRVADASRFPQIAAAFLQATNPSKLTKEEALKKPKERASKAVKAPNDSFEDYVEEEKLNGEVFRTFYAYYPNQYHDGVNWMQLLIIFPMEGCWNEESGLINEEAVDSVPDRMEGQDEEYDGEKYSDDYSHLETFATPTPEPDSAAKEYDGWY